MSPCRLPKAYFTKRIGCTATDLSLLIAHFSLLVIELRCPSRTLRPSPEKERRIAGPQSLHQYHLLHFCERFHGTGKPVRIQPVEVHAACDTRCPRESMNARRLIVICKTRDFASEDIIHSQLH